MNRPSLWELECFVAVAEELHFSNAAKRLHISQPPLSRQIQALEKKLGVQLLRRKTRTVELTLPGEVFLQDAREILRHLDRASSAAHRSGGGETERLRLGFISALLGSDLMEVLRSFRDQRPTCQLELLDLPAADQFSRIQNGTLDGGLIGGVPAKHSSDLKFLVWKTERWLVGLPERHPSSVKAVLSLQELRNEKWVLTSRATAPAFRERIDKLCTAAGFRPRVVLESDRTQAILAMVAAENGIGMFTETIARLIDRGVVFRPLNTQKAVLQHNLVWQADKHSKALLAFQKILRHLGRGTSRR
jgi:LysR family transcriptional regulator, benzoate and cis,cis-muconate-responsive activator of ben and cat genes